MELNVLAVGDVVSQAGLDFLRRSLPRLKRERGVHFTVVNGENAAGIGLFPNQAEDILDSGADVVTLGNHTWSKLQIADYLDAAPCVLRPANFAPRLPGRGYGVFDGPHGLRIGVLNLIGRVELNPNVDSPFTTADRILERPEADIVLVDFHADPKVLPRGTGHITDLGMTGPAESILGIRPEQSINLFLGGLPRRYEAAPGRCKLEAALFAIDTKTKRCTRVERVDLQE